uniref:Uncharacterized protein n=1 Tax=Utricularia reniformis TaxID=192314 RepID=A0A1Y0B000_9LAMI|nr:hypothetical protein AEK19_MT0438 [Utricularia reniformis]ART30701.1 hypothetical protein AEK19_MT0438 [Utricularia reniformis]
MRLDVIQRSFSCDSETHSLITRIPNVFWENARRAQGIFCTMHLHIRTPL